MPDLEPLWRLLLAAAFTLPIGLERELRGKPAGLRTHVLVALGSAAFGHVSLLAGGDPARIAAQVVSGVGFMGAGVVFASSGRVHGLTTAASLWVVSAIGLCSGLGQVGLAAALVAVAVVVLGPLDWLANHSVTRRQPRDWAIYLIADELEAIIRAQQLLAARGVSLRDLAIDPFGDRVRARLSIAATNAKAGEVVAALDEVPGLVVLADAPDLVTPESDG